MGEAASVAAVVLAAGRGSRLGAEGRGVPKCLTPVAGVPILLRALAALERAGAAQAVVVVGCMAAAVRAAVGPRFGALPVRWVENPRFAATGTCESLRLGLAAVEPGAEVIVLEGDVVFEDAVLHRLVAAAAPATVVEPWNSRLSGTFVEVDAQGVVTDWVHERDRPPATPLEGRFKTVNLTRFGAGAARGLLCAALDRAASEDGGRAPLETVMRRLVREEGVRIGAVPAGGLRWYEVDTPEDLAEAEALFAPGGAGDREQGACAGS